MIDENWVEEASCKGKLDIFFPDEEDSEYRKKVFQAKSICTNCPAKVNCLTHAISYGERHGVWAGMTVRQLSKLRNQIGIKSEEYIQNYIKQKVFNV